MNKIRNLLGAIIMMSVGFSISILMSQSALADPVQDDRNPATTGIPFVHTMNAGATANLDNITYTISITGTAKEDGTLGSYASTGIVPLALPFTNGVITPATPDPAVDADRSSDATKVWGDSKTLAQLFGSDDKSNTDTDTGYLKFSTNFPQAGIYKFTISETRAGADSSKWKYEPWNTAEDKAGTYTLVVFIANDTGANANVAERHYDGWYLIDNVTGDKVAINTADNAESGVNFTSTYKAISTLNVTKHVSGDYASTTFPFPQTITLTLPDWAADEDVEAIAPDGTTIAPVSGAGTATRVYNVELKHNDIVSFTVPVGTRYEVNETRLTDGGGLNYRPNITWRVDNGEGSNEAESPNVLTPGYLNSLVARANVSNGNYVSEHAADSLPSSIPRSIYSSDSITIEVESYFPLYKNGEIEAYSVSYNIKQNGIQAGGQIQLFNLQGQVITNSSGTTSGRSVSGSNGLPNSILNTFNEWTSDNELRVINGYYSLQVFDTTYYNVSYCHDVIGQIWWKSVWYTNEGTLIEAHEGSDLNVIPGIETTVEGWIHPIEYFYVDEDYRIANFGEYHTLDSDDFPETLKSELVLDDNSTWQVIWGASDISFEGSDWTGYYMRVDPVNGESTDAHWIIADSSGNVLYDGYVYGDVNYSKGVYFKIQE